MDASEYAVAARHLMAAKMYSLASCVMLFYDMFLTFGDEVEKIWKQPFTGATVLWFLNRYLTPLGYVVIIVSFNDPGWDPASCDRYVRFPEILKVITAAAVGSIFILRLYAIYGRSQWIFFTFTGLLLVELAVKIYSFTGGSRLQLPPGLVGCILTGHGNSDRIMATWIAELVFDSCVFIAMLYKTVYLYRSMPKGRASSIVHIMLRDGVVYFAVIFVSNLVTVLIYVIATPDLKVVNASFSTLITTLMVSRLMLNLRKVNDHMHSNGWSSPPSISTTIPQVRFRHTYRSFGIETSDLIPMTVIGNLGQPVETWGGLHASESDFSDASGKRHVVC